MSKARLQCCHGSWKYGRSVVKLAQNVLCEQRVREGTRRYEGVTVEGDGLLTYRQRGGRGDAVVEGRVEGMGKVVHLKVVL